MNTAVLFSGGKDSTLALAYARKHSDVKCLIIIVSENLESYMFHTPNIKWAIKQAEAIGLPAIVQKTKGLKEKELKDLEKAIKKAIKQYKIEGIVTGAIESVYQASRVQKITNDLGLECFNPLWQKDQIQLLNELVNEDYEVLIVGVFGYGLDDFIGRKIDLGFIDDMQKVYEKLRVNPAGEGGEFESFVLYAPTFKKKLQIEKYHVQRDKEGGIVLEIEELEGETK